MIETRRVGWDGCVCLCVKERHVDVYGGKWEIRDFVFLARRNIDSPREIKSCLLQEIDWVLFGYVL